MAALTHTQNHPPFTSYSVASLVAAPTLLPWVSSLTS